MSSRDTPHTIEPFRRIVQRRRYEELDGCIVDMQSANAICTVYDALSPKNKDHFFTDKAGNPRTASELGRIAWEVLSRSNEDRVG